MARAVWSGTVSFGLVNIPVSLYPATEPKDVRFHLYDRETGRRVHYRRVVDAGPADAAAAGEIDEAFESADDGPTVAEREPACDETERDPRVESVRASVRSAESGGRDVEVAFADLVRGVEVEPGRAVVLEPEEIERARPQRSRTIDIEEFVDLADVDPVYFDKSYYLAPRAGEQAAKPYALLLRALERSGRAGIGRFVLRTKPHLVALRPTGGVIGLETLFFGDEVRRPAEVVRGLEQVQVSDRELELAEGLIGMLATEWSPERHADDYREELLRIIAEKAPTTVAHDADAPAPVGSRLPDLMDALKRSVEAAKREQQPAAPSRRRRAR